jgi:hypothetical protein
VVRANEQDIKQTKEETMAKVLVYHSIDDDENKIYIDIKEIEKDSIKEMKKEYPKYDVEVVEFS